MMSVGELISAWMPHPLRAAQLLRSLGALCIVAALLFPFTTSEVRRAIGRALEASRFPASATSSSRQVQPLSLDDARVLIPRNLHAIYEALNSGNPAATRGLIAEQVINNSLALDRVCRPYAYRGSYVEAVLQRTDGTFEARVHALFQPVEEQADVLLFGDVGGQLVLLGVDPQPEYWLGEKKRRAIDVSRQFVYATKAAKRDVLSQLSSKNLDLSTLFSDKDYVRRASDIGTVSQEGSGYEQHEGLKVAVHFTTSRRDGWCSDLWSFLVDPMDGYKIVAWEFHPIVGCYRLFQPPSLERFEDANLEDYTLRRFGIRPSIDSESAGTRSTVPETEKPQQSTGELVQNSYMKVPEAAMSALFAAGEPPNYPPLAQAAGISGNVKLRVIVNASGVVEKVSVLSGHPMLTSTAVDAVKQWKYNPYVKDGMPVAVETEVTIPFSQHYESVNRR